MLDLTSILTLFVIFRRFRVGTSSRMTRDIKTWFYIVRAGAIAAALMLALLSFFVIGIFFFRAGIRRLHEKLGRIPPRVSANHGCTSSTRSRRARAHAPSSGFARVLLCTAANLALPDVAVLAGDAAAHHPLPFDSSFFVTGVTTIGLAIPTPGGIGGFHKACQLVLTSSIASTSIRPWPWR